MSAWFHALPPDCVVLADVAVAVLTGTVMTRLTQRLRQPPVIWEIATGIILGPSLLGLFPGHLSQRLFPADARPVLTAVSEIGLLFFMFLAGWEMDARLLRDRRSAVAVTAVSAMAVPFVLGLLLALALADDHRGHTSTSAFVLYFGTTMAITAFPVLARILRDSGLNRTSVGAMSLACAAVGDGIAWCLLVLVVAVVQADGPAQVLRTLLLVAVFAALLAWVVRPALRRLLAPRDDGDGGASRNGEHAPGADARLFLVVGAGALLSGCATSWIGIHPILGAFAFGLAMPRRLRHDRRRVIEAPLAQAATLLLPVYFIVTGLSVDISSLGWSGLGLLAVILLVAVSGKFAGSVVPARLFGVPWREAGALGILMNTRGLTELVVLGVGRQLGVIDTELFTVMVLMALITTAMAGPLLPLVGLTLHPPIPSPRSPVAAPSPATPPPATPSGDAAARAGQDRTRA
jgi:Kef-type K+ transport system membrane component KefB